MTVGLVTPEDQPLRIFGRRRATRSAICSTSEESSFIRARIRRRRGTASFFSWAKASSSPIASSLSRGCRARESGGIPQTFEGFVSVDEHGRVLGLDDVYAAGDITSFHVKQGGIAAQQAEAAAEAIAFEAGVELAPHPFRPVLRGLLSTARG